MHITKYPHLFQFSPAPLWLVLLLVWLPLLLSAAALVFGLAR